ncbi:hypothetical protein BDB00DRAFT_876759 [Zychaea mexicana]|uniref:uncharacterized protein n=1 Tax=Zychaea mexicana TaxID=64656 RepID=UPI0022FF2306|nr:uncharacterized protein BDB00DRAFT_876759 [Zychaea mexicana]KAI9489091.1 hypothetical protein BDB00DRAFT_876759 [Zychaea mexicana]
MTSLDFLASDIVFPSDSNEPKLSVNASSKLPDPVDWSLHDYYSTALEKTFVPIHSLTDLRKLDPVPQKEAFYEMPSFTVYNSNGHNNPKLQLCQDKMLLLLSIRKAVAAALPPQQKERQQPTTAVTKQQHAILPSHPPALEDPKEIRAALRGALELTQNDMQHNGFAHPSTAARSSKEWKWEDEILHDALEFPVARTPNSTRNNDNSYNSSGAAYLIDDDEDYDHDENDVASLPYCSSIEDDASSIAYSMSSQAAPPMPLIINHHFDDSTSTTSSTTTNTTLVSSPSSSVTAASSSRWSNVMGKLKSITKPFKSPTDKRSSSSSNQANNNQQQGGLRRFLLKRHLH